MRNFSQSLLRVFLKVHVALTAQDEILPNSSELDAHRCHVPYLLTVLPDGGSDEDHPRRATLRLDILVHQMMSRYAAPRPTLSCA